jgi:type IV pilus assembly protein PilC
MADARKEVGIFGGVYSRMTSIGNKTGALDQVMSQISDLYQEDIDNKINNRLAVLEPALIIVLSIIVGIILLSVMFPLLGIMASL